MTHPAQNTSLEKAWRMGPQGAQAPLQLGWGSPVVREGSVFLTWLYLWIMRAGQYWEGSAHQRGAGESGRAAEGGGEACGHGPACSTQKASVFSLSAALLGVFKSELAQCFCSCK